MKIFTALFFSAALLFSLPIAGSTFSDGSSSVTAQSVATRSKRKGRYVVRRTWNGTRWVTTQVRVGTRSPRKKTWRTGRKVVSRTKKIVL